MEVSGSSVILPEIVTLEKEEDEVMIIETIDKDLVPVVVSPSPAGNATVLGTQGESSGSKKVTEGQKKNSSQGSNSGDEKSNMVAEKDEDIAKKEVNWNLNGVADLDLLDLIANPAERVKIDAMSRRRKHVNFFVFNIPEEKPPIVVAKGEGCRLEEIPSIETQINKRPYFDLIRLHRFVFGKGGTTEEIKTRLKLFSGFSFTCASDEYEKKRQTLDKMDEMTRDLLCDCLALEKSGDKAKVMENLMTFLMKPKSMGEVCTAPSSEQANAKDSTSKAASTTPDEQDEAKTTTNEQMETPVDEPDELTDSQKTEESQEWEGTPKKVKTKPPIKAPKTSKRKSKQDKENKVLEGQEQPPPPKRKRKSKQDKDKENKVLEGQEQPPPPKRKKKAFNAPITDKSKEPNQKQSKSKPNK